MFVNHATRLVVFWSTVATINCQCLHGDIRLVNGGSELEGRVEACLNGEWGTACDDGWNTNAANVVCRQLGFADSGAILRHSNPDDSIPAPFGQGPRSQPIVVDNIHCTGSEPTLFECQFSTTSDCIHFEDIGVTCQPLPATTAASTQNTGADVSTTTAASVVPTTTQAPGTTTEQSVSDSEETETHTTSEATTAPLATFLDTIGGVPSAYVIGGVGGGLLLAGVVLAGVVVVALVAKRLKRSARKITMKNVETDVPMTDNDCYETKLKILKAIPHLNAAYGTHLQPGVTSIDQKLPLSSTIEPMYDEVITRSSGSQTECCAMTENPAYGTPSSAGRRQHEGTRLQREHIGRH